MTVRLQSLFSHAASTDLCKLLLQSFRVLRCTSLFPRLVLCCTDNGAPNLSGMVYDDAEKLYAEVRTSTEALIDNALRVLYPGSLPLSSAASASASGPLTVFAHNTTPFARRDIVRVPLAGGATSSGDVLQTTSDGKEGYIVLEGRAGGGLALPCQVSAKDLSGA